MSNSEHEKPLVDADYLLEKTPGKGGGRMRLSMKLHRTIEYNWAG
jgi:hypothetical protein